METPNIIAVAIFAAAVVCIIGVRIYSMNKNGSKVTVEDFIDMYASNIINVLKDVIEILEVQESRFPDKASYEKEIIRLTIEKIKENATELGIDSQLISLIGTDALSEVVYDLLTNNSIEIFSVLKPEIITQNKRLYEEEVITALGAAV